MFRYLFGYPSFATSIAHLQLLNKKEIYNEPKIITFKVKDNIELLETNIFYLQSYGNYVRVFTKNQFYLASITTQEILSNLSEELFVRVYKSYILNLSKIINYPDREVTIISNQLPIGITYKRDFVKKISHLSE